MAFLALPIAGAGAATGSSAYTRGIQVGPVTVGHGYKLTISEVCTLPRVTSAVVLTKAGRNYTISHYYNYYRRGKGSACTAARGLKSGSITVSWGSFLTAKLKFSAAGQRRPLQCRGKTIGHYREATGSGTLKMAIHPKVLGKLDLHRVKGQIQGVSGGSCAGGGISSVGLGAEWAKGSAQLMAFKSGGGKRSVFAYAPDNLSHRVLGSAADVFHGKGLFSFQRNLSFGKVSAFNPFLTGSLKYKASTLCSAGSTTGKLTGRMVLHDPVSGRFVYAGSRAVGPYMASSSGHC